MEADIPESKDGFSFIDKETYDSLPLTKWLDKSGKPKEDHPVFSSEHKTKEIELMLKSKIVRETLKAKGYDLDEVETGKVTVGEDLRKLLERLADDKLVVSESGRDRREVTILKKREVKQDGDLTKSREPQSKEVVRTLNERIQEKVLRRTTIRKKSVSF